MRRIAALAVVAASFAALAAPAVAGTTNVKPWSFDPTPVTIKQGDTVKWSWTNAVAAHNVYIATSTGKAVKNSGAAKKTGTYSYKFTTKGTFTVYCNPHRAFMQTTVTVS